MKTISIISLIAVMSFGVSSVAFSDCCVDSSGNRTGIECTSSCFGGKSACKPCTSLSDKANKKVSKPVDKWLHSSGGSGHAM